MRKIIFYGILIFIFSIFTGYMYSKLWKSKNKLETIADYNNKTYEYTHGYGIVVTSATGATQEGNIKYIQNIFYKLV